MVARTPAEVGGLLAAAAAGLMLGRIAEARLVRAAIVDAASPPVDDLGSLRTPHLDLMTDDGTRLHVEVDETDPHADHLADGDVTVIFSHGYCLSLDCWHYQRAALRGRVRMVFWDQRGHGRSERGPAESATIQRFGQDLKAVIDATAPTGRLVLVGHSMGGMTLMALAATDPGVFRERVVGVALLSTSTGGVLDEDLGLGRTGSWLAQHLAALTGLAAHRATLTGRVRGRGTDAEGWLVHHWSYAEPVAAELLDFTTRLVAATHLDVVTELVPEFSVAQEHWALTALQDVPVLVLTGDRDHLIPAHHSERLAAALPQATLEVVLAANHLVMLEHPARVNRHLVQLLGQTAAHDGGTAGE